MLVGLFWPKWVYIKRFGYAGLFSYVCTTDNDVPGLTNMCFSSADGIFAGKFRSLTVSFAFITVVFALISLIWGTISLFTGRKGFFYTAMFHLLATITGYLATYWFYSQFSDDNEELRAVISRHSDVTYDEGYFVYLAGVNFVFLASMASGLTHFNQE
ncbi:unnamed protein product [Bursaphelenchus okinawaensis]|uniref:MARVEL domain-containing protein n=1 Tax=Bursaphelenchus okinawaensis TaxID=465554 RepID=A0A811KB54_9BILA|nr:unnamed protein product [Bursaphelenchus okinawaensis]CAG9098653.1 unnamed protein product [Bursaphelenchus okinawaensis]